MSTLDLSVLEDKVVSDDVAPHSGKPLNIPLADIEEDPNQPRQEFSEEAMRDMKASIVARGVKTPVSVRHHPKKPNKWILNYGARRYRASIAAGKTDIPAFIDELHDDFDQVIENIQRDDLKPMELAQFIKKRIEAGDSKAGIARKLGKDAAVITQHLALIDLPACIQEIYASGKCTSPKTLYELRSLFDNYPEKVQIWCKTTENISRKAVSILTDELKGRKKLLRQIDEQVTIKSLGHDQGLVSQVTDESVLGEHIDQPAKAGVDIRNQAVFPNSESQQLRKPLLIVKYQKRSAAVLLHCKPSKPGLIHIRFENGEEMEVKAELCKINSLIESKK